MVQRLSLKQSSCQADESCVVYCNREANLVLKCDKSVLMRVTTSDDAYHFVWADPLSKLDIPEYCPIFKEDDDEAICEIKDVMTLNVNDIFCHYGEAYYLSQNTSETLVIRRLSMYSSQHIVEEISKYDEDPEPVEDIKLAKLYDLRGGRRFVMYCWLVWRESSLNYVPVFDGDDKKLDELSFSLCQRDILPIGSLILHANKPYYLSCGADDKLFIGKGANIFPSLSRDQTREEEPESSQPRKAIIISMRNH